MREIKFRGKRIDREQFVYGHYFETPLSDENSGTDPKAGWFFLSDGKGRCCISSDSGVVYAINPRTLGEYTGLLDCNGKEIYEGDYVVGDFALTYKVYFRFGEWRIGNDSLFKYIKSNKIKVVGNIHHIFEVSPLPEKEEE